MAVDDNRWQVRKHKIFVHRLVIDFRCQSINCYRLLSIVIDYWFHQPRSQGLFTGLCPAPPPCQGKGPGNEAGRAVFLRLLCQLFVGTNKAVRFKGDSALSGCPQTGVPQQHLYLSCLNSTSKFGAQKGFNCLPKMFWTGLTKLMSAKFLFWAGQ